MPVRHTRLGGVGVALTLACCGTASAETLQRPFTPDRCWAATDPARAFVSGAPMPQVLVLGRATPVTGTRRGSGGQAHVLLPRQSISYLWTTTARGAVRVIQDGIDSWDSMLIYQHGDTLGGLGRSQGCCGQRVVPRVITAVRVRCPPRRATMDTAR